ncbi:MAG TPA: hypothetical protein VI385_06985, partial [Flavisolibacter sp.]
MSRTCPVSYKERDIYGASTGGIWGVHQFGQECLYLFRAFDTGRSYIRAVEVRSYHGLSMAYLGLMV